MLVTIRVLPDGIIAPTSRELSDRAGIASNDERTGRGKLAAVSSAGFPPACRGVDQRIAAGARVVGVDKVGDPVDHAGRGEAVAGGTARVVLHVEHSGQCDAIARPPAAIGEEVLGLSGPGRAGWLSEVIASSNQFRICRACVVAAELGVLVRRTLCRLVLH